MAFFITAMSLGVLYQIYAKGATALDLARDYASALSIAESKLAEAIVHRHAATRQGTGPVRLGLIDTNAYQREPE